MTTAAEYNVNMSANITSVKYVKLPVHVSDTEAGVTTIRIAYTNHVVVQLLREIYEITINKHKYCKMEFDIYFN
jgi:hypothetical protein